MAVGSLEWVNAIQRRNLHLVPGLKSPRLGHVLRVPGQQSGNLTDLTANFRVSFAHSRDVEGVSVSADGEVEVASLPSGSSWPQTSLVTCTVKDQNTNDELKARIRLVFHQAIERVWLTPAQFDGQGNAISGLTVRQDAKNMRFSLLAKFADGEIGDISNWCPFEPPAATDRTYVRRSTSSDPVVSWSATGNGMTVDINTGLLACASATADVQVLASITAPINRSASAPAKGAVPWSTSVSLEKVHGDFSRMDRVKNVLILPEGFSSGQKKEFQSLAKAMVTKLLKNEFTTPYKLLGDQFNFFMAWVPSPDSGVSVLNELKLQSGSSANAYGAEFPPNQLIATADRLLANERNTAFHLAIGERPAADPLLGPQTIWLHPARLATTDLTTFINALTDDSGDPLSGNPASPPIFVFLCRSDRLGANNILGLVIAMALDVKGRHGVKRSPVGNGFDLRDATIKSDRAVLRAWPILAHEIAHSFNLGDEYGGDPGATIPEGKQGSIDGSPNVQRRATLLTAGQLDADKIKWRWPRMEKAGVLSAGLAAGQAQGQFVCTLRAGHGGPFKKGDIVRLRAPTLSGLLTVDGFFNNAPQIELNAGETLQRAHFPAGSTLISELGESIAVGLLAEDLAADGVGANGRPRFLCKLHQGHRAAFEKDDVVRLRAKNFVGAPISHPLEVTKISGNVLDLKLVPGGIAPALPEFLAGALLFVPPPPDADAPGEIPLLVKKSILDRIKLTKNPLNAKPNATPNTACAGGSVQWKPQPAVNFVGKAPDPPDFPPWIIGLYESGATFDCHVYHATGICIMAIETTRDAQKRAPEVFYQFCPVCRYAMVDQLDPSKHGKLEVAFKDRFEKKK